MAVRDKAGLRQQVTTLLLDNTTEQISEADVRSVLNDMIDSFALASGGGGGVVTALDVRVVWSADRAVTAAELDMGESFSSNTFAIPAHVGFAYLAIWRADADGGAPSGIMFDGQPQRAAFDDDGADLTASDGTDGEYIASIVELDGDDIGGDEMELTG